LLRHLEWKSGNC